MFPLRAHAALVFPFVSELQRLEVWLGGGLEALVQVPHSTTPTWPILVGGVTYLSPKNWGAIGCELALGIGPLPMELATQASWSAQISFVVRMGRK